MITLDNLDYKSPQAVFDFVVNHLLKQNAQAMIDNRCLYRTSDGLKCAVGCLIKDNEYNLNMERRPIPRLPDLNNHFTLLRDLQIMHDCQMPSKWPAYLQNLASEHGLIYNSPTMNESL